MATRKTTPKITTEIVTITPDLADEWLSHNTHNRQLRNRTVNQLADAIKRGEWIMNGDAIRFAADGTLLDGQHRLWAISISEIACEALVIRGLPNESQMTMDMGARRKLADHLKLQGFTSSTTLAAILNFKWRLDNGYVRTAQVPTIQQAMEILDAHPDLTDAVAAAGRFHRRFPGSTAVVGTIWYETMSIDSDAAEAFWDQLIEGLGLTEGSPVLAMRRHLETNAKISQPMLAALLIKSWNAYYEGREIDRVYWRPVGVNAERFPVISGKSDSEDA